MGIQFHDKINLEKLTNYAEMRMQDLSEREHVRRAVSPILKEWIGKKPNKRLVDQIRQALGKGERQYYVHGCKGYSAQEIVITGRNVYGPERVHDLGAVSFLSRGNACTIHLGYLDNGNYTVIDGECWKHNLDALSNCQKAAYDLRCAVRQGSIKRWADHYNSALDALQQLYRTVELDAPQLTSCFDPEYNRDYGVTG